MVRSTGNDGYMSGVLVLTANMIAYIEASSIVGDLRGEEARLEVRDANDA